MRMLLLLIAFMFSASLFGADICYVNKSCDFDEDGTAICENHQIQCSSVPGFACDYAHEQCDEYSCVVPCAVQPLELTTVTIEAERPPEPVQYAPGGLTGYGNDGGPFETNDIYSTEAGRFNFRYP